MTATFVPAGARHVSVPMLSPTLVSSVLDALPGMVGYWDAGLRNVIANDAYVEYFGVAPERLRGMHLRELLGPDLFAASRRHIEGALAGRQQTFTRTMTDRAGRTRHTQATYLPDIQDGVVVGFLAQVTDITERVDAERALARSVEQYRALARSIPGGFVLLFDTELRYLVAEGRDLARFGFSADDLEGRTMDEALPPSLAAELGPHYRAALAGADVRWERQVGRRIYELTAAPVRGADGEVFAGMVLARNATRERRSQLVLEALSDVATCVARHDSAEQVGQRIAMHLTATFGLASSGVVRFTDRLDGEIVATFPARPAGVPRIVDFVADPASAAARVQATAKPAIVDYRTHGDRVSAAMRAHGYEAGAAVPIRHQGALWGCLCVADGDPRAVSPELLSELAGFAELLQIALDNLEAWGRLSVQAGTDSLTGLPNRRRFDERLARGLERAAETGRPLSVVVLDIDHFKAINDTHGHPAGDAVLQEVAATLAGSARATELVARLGGEEFGWLLPDTTREQALHAAERARAAVATRLFAPAGAVTVSAGVCSTADVVDPEQVCAGADRALYAAKHRGRNVTVAHGG